MSSSGGRRFSEGTSADREIQRTLMEVGGHKVVFRYVLLFHKNIIKLAYGTGTGGKGYGGGGRGC